MTNFDGNILVIIAYAHLPLINVTTDVSCEARWINFGLSLHMLPYSMCSSSHGCRRVCAYAPESSLLDNATMR